MAIKTYDQVASSGGSGQKARTLGELALAGFRVPPGVCVSSDLSKALLGDLDRQTPDAALAALDHANLADVADELRCALPAQRLIVRSSSPVEDLPEMPTYGFYGSAVCDRSGLEDALRHCLAAAFRPGVLAYKSRVGLPALEHHALLVQEYIVGSPSGVGLSRDLPHGHPEGMLLELADGPCSRVTSGDAIPSAYRRSRGGQHVELVSRAGAYDPALVSHLFDMLAAVEAALGYPIDVEFTKAAEGTTVLQARRLPTMRAATTGPSAATFAR